MVNSAGEMRSESLQTAGWKAVSPLHFICLQNIERTTATATDRTQVPRYQRTRCYFASHYALAVVGEMRRTNSETPRIVRGICGR